MRVSGGSDLSSPSRVTGMEIDLGRGHSGHPAELLSIRHWVFDVIQTPVIAESGEDSGQGKRWF